MECHNKSKKGGVVMEVVALLNGVKTTFTDLGNNVFEAELTAPNHDATYEIEITATSTTGEYAKSIVELSVASWITPKVNWVSTDRFNLKDFNRIRNNMIALQELIEPDFGIIELHSMGEELTEYSGRWSVEHFNAFEKNLEIFNQYLPLDNFGVSQSFYYNGLFIKHDELNRIENLLLRFMNYATKRKVGVRKVPFRLGAFKEVRV